MVIPLAEVENLNRTTEINFELVAGVSFDKVHCAYQINHPVNGATEPGSGNCQKCLEDKEHNPECPGFRGVVPLKNDLVMRIVNSSTVYCPLRDRDIIINSVCCHALGSCKFYRGLFSMEIGEGVLCGYRVGKG